MKMKNIFAYIATAAALCLCASCDTGHNRTGDEEPAYKPDSVYMIGASIAFPENTWFEMGCEELGLTPVNRAVSGTRPSDSAMRMRDGMEYTTAELDRFGVLVVMHVHDRDVCDEGKLREDYRDYDLRTNMNYSQAFDYIIRRYIDDCRALETDPESLWYGVAGGKPVRIMLCTYWHDARVVYNSSVRRLAERWKEYASLCAFDENIGFTKERPDADGNQVSLQFARNGYGDTEVIDGVTYGWHPTRGRNAEIQQRMARIFVDAMQEVVGR